MAPDMLETYRGEAGAGRGARGGPAGAWGGRWGGVGWGVSYCCWKINYSQLQPGPAAGRRDHPPECGCSAGMVWLKHSPRSPSCCMPATSRLRQGEWVTGSGARLTQYPPASRQARYARPRCHGSSRRTLCTGRGTGSAAKTYRAAGGG